MGFFKWKASKILISICISTIIVSIVVDGYLLGMRKKLSPPLSQPTPLSQQLKVTQSSPTSFPTTLDQPTSPAGWKTYHSIAGGYSVQIPTTSSWTITHSSPESPPAPEEQATYMEMFLKNEQFPLDDLYINPDEVHGESLETLASFYGDASGFIKQTAFYTQIAGHRALVKTQVYNTTPPKDFSGDWYDRSEKYVYIDLGKGIILTIHTQWENTKPEYEKLFNHIIYSLKVDK